MKTQEFLTYAGERYETNKRKWKERLKKIGYKFSDDIYNDSIIKVYDKLNENEHLQDIQDMESYWYMSFLNNTKRETTYIRNTKKDDTIDVYAYLDTIPDEPPSVYEFKKDKGLSIQDTHLFLIYNLTDITYKELQELTNTKDIKYKIKMITTKFNANKQDS